MNLSELKNILQNLSEIRFVLPNGEIVPSHFHITEVGQVTKHFIDCGGVVRLEKTINFQLWQANDYDHRLSVSKLKDIIALSENKLQIEDGVIEVEYQQQTISKYGLEFKENEFHLTQKFTDCLAPDKCGVPQEKPKIKLSELTTTTSCCAPGTNCC
jgi:hypothetical protein